MNRLLGSGPRGGDGGRRQRHPESSAWVLAGRRDEALRGATCMRETRVPMRGLSILGDYLMAWLGARAACRRLQHLEDSRRPGENIYRELAASVSGRARGRLPCDSSGRGRRLPPRPDALDRPSPRWSAAELAAAGGRADAGRLGAAFRDAGGEQLLAPLNRRGTGRGCGLCTMVE